MKTFLSLMMMSACGVTLVDCAHAQSETITTTTTVTASQLDVAARATVQAVYDGFAVGDMDRVTGVI